MSTYQPTKTFLLHAEEGRVDLQGGREIGIRPASSAQQDGLPHSLLQPVKKETALPDHLCGRLR